MREIDTYQRKAINADFNAVVSAGAGSGKTTVLSERFTDLVLNRNCEVDEILTLTFTKKATVEMSSRIYKVLKEKAPEKAKDFYKANIKTLDSYCNSVAKTGCHLYGITPDFTQNEKVIFDEITALALPFILENRNNLAIKALVNTKDYAAIASELFVTPMIKESTISEPIDFEEGIKKQKQEIIKAWKKYTTQALDIHHSLNKELEAFEGNRSIKFITNLEQLLAVEIPEPPVITEETFEEAGVAVNTPKTEVFTKIFKNISDISLPGRANGVAPLKELIVELRENVNVLISLCNYISGYYITKALIPLLIDFQNKVNSLKRNLGILTFKDISSMATCILRDYPELRQIEKEKYKAIMIDEFQDNNQMQRDMLFMIAERLDIHKKGIPEVNELCPDKLFFVGDEKQSIYRFRGADVSVFRALSADFSEGNLSMTTNYRSHPSLIKSFNIIFGGKPSVFYTEQDEKKAQEEGKELPIYEAVYHDVTIPTAKEAEAAKNPQQFYTPHIHIARFDKETQTTGYQLTHEEAEAQWVAEKIKELAEVGVNGVKYNASKIAILLRNYSLQPLYERTLLSHGIPYNTEIVTGFFADGPVNDIFSFLRICIYEKDTLSYAQVLRSPFVNLSVEETNAIILSKETPFEGTAEKILTGTSLKRYLHAKAFYDEIKESSKTESLTKIISKLWYNAGYRYETMWNEKVSMYSKMYDLIFELAHQSEQNNMSLSAFVDSVRAYTDQSKKLEGMDIPMEKASGVNILTIHKSKGLEYDVVFICGTHKTDPKDANRDPIYSSKEFGITVNTPPSISFPKNKDNYFYNLVAGENRMMENAELRRIVYVAITRASNEIYITNGKYSPSKEPEKYLPGNEASLDSIYHTLEPIISFYESPEYTGKPFFDVETIPPYNLTINNEDGSFRKNNIANKIELLNQLEENQVYENSEIIKKETVASKYIQPSQLDTAETPNIKNNSEKEQEEQFTEAYKEINKIIEASIPRKNGKPIPGAEPRFDYTHFGTIAHAYLEAAITGETEIYINREIVGLENQERDLPIIINACKKMQEQFKKSEIGIKAINSVWHKAEYEFRSKIDNKIVKGFIDLLFKNPDGTYTIIDYKTDQKIEPELHYAQLACYLNAVSQMTNVDRDSICCCLYYLRFGKMVDVTKECKKIKLTDLIKNL